MENTMFTLRMLPMRTIFGQKKRLNVRSRNAVIIITQEQIMLLLQPEPKDVIQRMMGISSMHLISLRTRVMLISFLTATITITFLRMSYQLASWLLQKPIGMGSRDLVLLQVLVIMQIQLNQDCQRTTI
ncbi:Uncharacterised protein [Streptococcus pneumoniae]|nr:Uncharacterised protein [Streptococcus pneumoniae]